MRIFSLLPERIACRAASSAEFQIKMLRCQAGWLEAAASTQAAHLAELDLAGRGRGPHGGRHGAAGPADHVRCRVIVLGRLQPRAVASEGSLLIAGR